MGRGEQRKKLKDPLKKERYKGWEWQKRRYWKVRGHS